MSTSNKPDANPVSTLAHVRANVRTIFAVRSWRCWKLRVLIIRCSPCPPAGPCSYSWLCAGSRRCCGSRCCWTVRTAMPGVTSEWWSSWSSRSAEACPPGSATASCPVAGRRPALRYPWLSHHLALPSGRSPGKSKEFSIIVARIAQNIVGFKFF